MSNDLVLDLCEALGNALLGVVSKHRDQKPLLRELAARYAMDSAPPAVEEPPVLKAAERTEPAAEVQEATAPAPVQTETPDPEPVQPTQEQVTDANYPRINLISWLVSRGFARPELMTKSREELESACMEQLKAIASVAPGVKKRGRPAKAKPEAEAVKVDPKVELTSRIKALGPVAFGRLAELYELSGDPEDVTNNLVEILETSEALDMAIDGLTDEDPDGLAVSVTVDPPAAPPIGSAVEEPVSQVAEPEPEVCPTTINSGHDLFKVVSKLYGYEGKLYNCVTSEKLAQFIEPVQNIYQQTAQQNDANGAAFKQHLKTMGCTGTCTACPRGAGQVAVCAAILDSNIVHEPTLKMLLAGAEDVPDAPEGDLLFVKFLEGKMLVKFKQSGKPLDDAEAGEAEIEAIL